MSDPLWLLLIGMIVVIGSILVLRLHAFLALILGALIVALITPDSMLDRYAKERNLSEQQISALKEQSPGEQVASEFGRTCGRIGIMIAMASIIGKCLLESGSAERIVRTAIKIIGEKRAPLAFYVTGFFLAMPVFFDTVFYLMIPLAKTMGIRTKRNYTLLVLAIVAGGTMSHSLVPPTPGPLFVAGELSINLGVMIIGGTVIGLFASLAGYLYALMANRKWPIPVRDTVDVATAQLKELSARDDKTLPPFGISILPVLLPLILIAGGAIFSRDGQAGMADTGMTLSHFLSSVFGILGNANIALSLSAGIALGYLALRKRGSRNAVSESIQKALSSGGIIILITSAGGAFGSILQQTGIGGRILEMDVFYRIGVIPLAFLVTALIRTAQGSATVAMITAVGITKGLATTGSLGFHPLYLALAIGCGSKLVSWMNDSGFWLISKMAGFTESETLRTFSATMAVMGLAGLLFIMFFARLFPLV